MHNRPLRHALLTGALAIATSASMLVGTTFAWFTDTVSTGINTIQSGNLKLGVYHTTADGPEAIDGLTNLFVNADGQRIAWEPGASVSETFTIRNEGSLALKYQFRISVSNATQTPDGRTLAEALMVSIDGAEAQPLSNFAVNNVLQAREEAHEVTVKIFWPNGGDNNNWNVEGGLSLDLGIAVVATQHSFEVDGTDDSYDTNAQLPTLVVGQAALDEAIAGGRQNLILGAGTYTLPQLTNQVTTISGTKDTRVDMGASAMTGAQNGNLDITFDGVTVCYSDTADYKGITHASRVTYKNCTLEGKQFLYAENVQFSDCTFTNARDYCVWTYGAANVSFDRCTFLCGGKAVLIYREGGGNTKVAVNDCTFIDDGSLDTMKAAVEVGDSAESGSKTFSVELTMKNNTVYGFAVNNEGAGTGNCFYGNKNDIPADRLRVTLEGNAVTDTLPNP